MELYLQQQSMSSRRFIKVIDKYGLTESLGEGMYGKVYKGVNNQTNEEVAVKVIQSDKFVRNPQLEEYTVNEIKVLTELGDTPHIVRYLDMLKTANNYYFVYEYCNGGTLQKQISGYKNTIDKVIPLSKTLIYFGEILSAFKLLTKNKIMHRDLKPDNILLHNGRIKIADFGFSKSLRSPTDLAQTMLGSPIYMAPEVLNGQPYTMKADIWSLGVVLYEMAFGDCPFKSQQIAKLIQILQVEQVKYPKTVPASVENLLRRMLVKDASKRIDWVDLFEYKVTESGELIEPASQINRLSGIGSNTSYTSNLRSQGALGFLGGSNAHQTQHARRSPMPNDRQKESRQHTSNIRGDHRFLPPTTSARDQHGQLKHLSMSHQRTISAVKLSMQVLRRQPKQSIGLAFIINKIVYKELNSILEQLNKDWLGCSNSDKTEHNLVIHFKEIVIDELIQLDASLKLFKQVVESLQGDVNMIEFKKSKYLRSFYKAYKFHLQEDEEAILLILQMMDFFEQSTLHKKQHYRKMEKYELLKELDFRINALD